MGCKARKTNKQQTNDLNNNNNNYYYYYSILLNLFNKTSNFRTLSDLQLT